MIGAEYGVAGNGIVVWSGSSALSIEAEKVVGGSIGVLLGVVSVMTKASN